MFYRNLAGLPMNGMLSLTRARILVAIAISVIAGAVWFTLQAQRSAAARSLGEQRVAEQLFLGMLGQAAALRGYGQTADKQFLPAYTQGKKAFAAALRVSQATSTSAELRAALAAQTEAAHTWQRHARVVIAVIGRLGTRSVTTENARHRKRLFDAFRAKTPPCSGVCAPAGTSSSRAPVTSPSE